MINKLFNAKLEIIFTTFLISGMIKVFLFYFDIFLFFDLTLFLGFILVFLLIFDCYKSKCRIHYNDNYKYPLLIILSLVLLMIISFFYTSSENYVYMKFFQFLTVVLAFFIPLFHHKFHIDRFLKVYVLMTVVTTLVYIPLFISSYSSSILNYSEYMDSDTVSIYAAYLVMGYMIGPAILILLFGNIFINKWKVLLIFILFFSLLLTGARGPLIFVLFIILLRVIVKPPKKPTIKTIILGVSISIGSVFFLLNFVDYSSLFDRTYSRIIALDNLSKDAASSERLEQLHFVMDKMTIQTFLHGYGFGSYGIERMSVDRRDYPHNVIFELLFEIGIIGVLLYLLFLLIIFRYLNKISFLYMGLFIYLVLNSLKSSSIADARIMFGFFAIFILVYSGRSIKNENS